MRAWKTASNCAPDGVWGAASWSGPGEIMQAGSPRCEQAAGERSWVRVPVPLDARAGVKQERHN